MERRTRIRLVVAIAVCAASLFIGLVLAPLVVGSMAQESVSGFAQADSPVEMGQAMQAMAKYGEISQVVSAVFLTIATLSFLYAAVLIAIWFIGPKEPEDRSAQPT